MSKEKTIKELATAILNLQSGYKTLQGRIGYLEQRLFALENKPNPNAVYGPAPIYTDD